MADGSVTLDTSLETSGLEKALNKLNDLLKRFSNQANDSFEDLDDALETSSESAKDLKIIPDTNGIDEAVRSLDILNARIENQSKLLDNYQAEYARVAQRYGETSDEALNMQKKILSAEDAISRMTKQSDTMADNIRKAEKAMENGAEAADDLGKASGDAGDSMSKGSKGVSTFQIALGNLVAQGLQSAVSAVWDLVDSTRELRTDLSLLEQNASDAGVSFELINEKMRETAAITGETDSAVEALSNLLASGFDENQLVSALDAITGAYIRFPDTMKIENLAESLQETIATGQATGQFAEILDRLGVNVDRFNTRMSDTESVARRQNIALQELARSGLGEVADEYRNNNEALLEGAQAQYDYETALSSVAEALEPLKAGVLQQLTELLNENRHAIEVVGEVITGILSILLKLVEIIAKLPPELTITIAMILLAVTAFVKIADAIKSVSGFFGQFTGIVSGANPLFDKLYFQILLIVAAFTALALAIAAVKDSIKGAINLTGQLKDIMPNTKVSNAYPSNSRSQIAGYASGTRSANPGLAWVGENGPELVNFKGGEVVYNATQSAAMAGMAQRRTPTISNYYVTIDAKNVQEFNDIVRIAQNERQSYRMGYVGR